MRMPPLATLQGALVVALLVVPAARQSATPAPGPIAAFQGPLVLTPPVPHPRHWVRVDYSTPLTVPSGKVFVLMAAGEDARSFGGCVVHVNGNQLYQNSYASSGSTRSTSTMVQAHSGFRAGPGSVVSLPLPGMQVWGYVVDPAAGGEPGLVVPPISRWVEISSSFVVPAGKILVIRSFGRIGFSDELLIDGVRQVTPLAPSYLPFDSITSLPLGLAATEGQVVSTPYSLVPIYGFLVDA